MLRIIYIILAVLTAIVGGCLALAGAGVIVLPSSDGQQQVTDDSPRSELVIDLPEDGGLWSLTLVYQSADRSTGPDRRLRSAVAAEPRLRSLVAQTSLTQYDPTVKLWQEKFRETMGEELPQVWLQSDSGRVVYKASGGNLPLDPVQLADELQLAIAQFSESHQMHQASDYRPPTPRPDAQPGRPTRPFNRIPDMRPSLLKPSRASIPPGLLLAAVAGLLAGVIVIALVKAGE